MSVPIVVDMNLSVEWIPFLEHAGWPAVHWSDIGDPQAEDTPEARDVDKGNALNSVLERMNAGLIQESSHRYVNVPLSVDQVRRIPFKLAARGITSPLIVLTSHQRPGDWNGLAADERLFESGDFSHG